MGLPIMGSRHPSAPPGSGLAAAARAPGRMRAQLGGWGAAGPPVGGRGGHQPRRGRGEALGKVSSKRFILMCC